VEVINMSNDAKSFPNVSLKGKKQKQKGETGPGNKKYGERERSEDISK
jgi:hypothetical protein